MHFRVFTPPKDHTTYYIYIEYQYGSENGIVPLLEKFGIVNYELVELDNYEQVLEILHDKKADAGVVNRIFGNRFQNRYDIQRTDIIFNPVELRFAFPNHAPKNQLLISRIDDHLARMKQDPSSYLFKLINIYFQENNYDFFGDNVLVLSDTVEPIDLTDEEKKWIKAHPVIRLGIDPEFIPFEFMTDKKEYMGIAKDYVCLLNARLGLNMQVAGNRSWTQFVEMAKKKKIDVFPCVGITQERKKYLLFSQP